MITQHQPCFMHQSAGSEHHPAFKRIRIQRTGSVGSSSAPSWAPSAQSPGAEQPAALLVPVQTCATMASNNFVEPCFYNKSGAPCVQRPALAVGDGPRALVDGPSPSAGRPGSRRCTRANFAHVTLVLLGGAAASRGIAHAQAQASRLLEASPTGSNSSSTMLAPAALHGPNSAELTSGFWQQQQQEPQQQQLGVASKRTWQQAAAAPVPPAASAPQAVLASCLQLQPVSSQGPSVGSFSSGGSSCGHVSAGSTPDSSALLAAARRHLVARRSSLLVQQQHSTLAATQQLLLLQQRQRQQAAVYRVHQQLAVAMQQAAAAAKQRAAAVPMPPSATEAAAQSLLRWCGGVLRVTCHDAYLLAQHLWGRVARRLDSMLLVSLGAAQPGAVAMLVCLWVAAKLEDNRRNVAPASRLAKACCMLPWGVTTVELHIMQLLDWQPYAGWHGGSSGGIDSSASCSVTECL